MRPANRAAPRRIPSQSWRLDPVSGLSEGNSALHAFPGIPDVLRMHPSCLSDPARGKASSGTGLFACPRVRLCRRSANGVSVRESLDL
jgi:hypothetical protein